MKPFRFRNLMFTLHRYVGLAVGLILVVIGLTGSILVFKPEIDRALIHAQFGKIIPQPQFVSIEAVVDAVRAAKPNWRISGIDLALMPDDAIRVALEAPNQASREVLVNPYTGQILGERIHDRTFMVLIEAFHYTLAAGETGVAIAGIAALLLFILSITGIFLWSGWRKLISGFKIKWNGHIKRVNFDIHKVAGIFTAIFLALTGFTGFAWNFYPQIDPLIYAITFTPKPIAPVSKVVPGKSTVSLAEILERADAALPKAKLTYINLPASPEGVFQVNKQVPGEHDPYRSRVYLDRYTGEVLQLRDSRSLLLGDQVLDSFTPLHFGTFGGLPTRILYVVVGLAPAILMVTGFIMWWYRKRPQTKRVAFHNSPRI
ncbi:peptidase (plasmid) [Leptolyngbya sp. NIES-3755]|nr:peptidase [Leptolyngbya sp. NIES-3755]